MYVDVPRLLTYNYILCNFHRLIIPTSWHDKMLTLAVDLPEKSHRGGIYKC